jgi:hypothetical protein
MASIFIQIASYQDYELADTILDAIKKSSKDHTLNFGVYINYITDDFYTPNLPNIKYTKIKAPDGIGVGFARFEANALYGGEDYYLQIDSHTRFIENWDTMLVDLHREYVSEGFKPIISTRPLNYWYEESNGGAISFDSINNSVQTLEFPVTDPGNRNNIFTLLKSVSNPEGNKFSKSISAGSCFASGEYASVLPNKKVQFLGEEQFGAARYYTHGFDLMMLKKHFMWHLYFNKERGFRNFRNHTWKDFPELCAARAIESEEEIVRIIRGKVIGDQEFGTKRTLEDYEDFAGIKFNAPPGSEPQAHEPPASQPQAIS